AIKPVKRGALGKGLNSLLGLGEEDLSGDVAANTAITSERVLTSVLHLDIDSIEPNPHQPRKLFDDDALQSLVASIKEDGVLQPVIVAKGDKPDRFILIAGERRWRASKLAGATKIPAIVKDGVSDDMLRLALIENIQRADLNIIEEAEAYASL